MASDPLLDMVPSAHQPTLGFRLPPPKVARERYQEFSQELAHAPVAVRAPMEAAPGILQTGDIRSQHETGSSKGYFDPELRGKAEAAMGFDDHPVYGYLDTHQDNLDANHYGAMKFTMKDSVKDRTTILNGDSLTPTMDHVVPPVPARNVQRGRVRLPKDSDPWTDIAYMNEPKIRGYVEAQIHATPGSDTKVREGNRMALSRVPLSDAHSLDISHPRTKPGLNPDLTKLGAQFQERGVPVWHEYSGSNYQAPLPFSGQELQAQGFEDSPAFMGIDGAPVRYDPDKPARPENFDTTRRRIHQRDLT